MSMNITSEDAEYNNVRYKEDRLFNENVVRQIERCHDMEYVSHMRYLRIDGFELDVVAFFQTKRGITRSFGFELKEANWEEVLLQTLKRRYLFDYYYVVIDLRSLTLFRRLFWYNMETTLKELYEIKYNKIGIICRDGILIPSGFKKGSFTILNGFEG